MRKLCSLLVLAVLLLVTPVSAMTPQEVLKKEGIQVGTFRCPVDQTIGIIDSVEENWKIFLNGKNGKIIMIEGDEEGNVVRVIFGNVELVEKKELKLEIYSEMSVEDAKKYFPNLCNFLVAKVM